MNRGVPLYTFDKLLELAAWVLLLLVWLAPAISYLELPDLIPIHYNMRGAITKYGNKITLLFFPLTATIMLSALTWMNRHPELFHTIKGNLEEERFQQYFYCSRLLRWLKISIAAVFLIVLVFIYFNTTGQYAWTGPWLLPIIIVVIMSPVLYYISRLLATK